MSDVDNSDFVKSIEKATVKIITNTTNNMEKACLIVEGDAKKRCPIDLGLLRSSMGHNVNFDSKEIVGTVYNSAEYAPYVHNGTGIYAKDGNGRKTPWAYNVVAGKYKGFHITKGQRPQPFLQEARDLNRNKILRMLAKEG